jgi:hypothetical protein
VYNGQPWPEGVPIIDAVAPDGGWDDVAAALSAVGLGSVPAWLRPFSVLSTGEKFRAELARVVSEAPARVVTDEFTSVVDRQRKSARRPLPRHGGVPAGRRFCCPAITTSWTGLRFLNEICRLWQYGENRYNKPMRTLFHTSHPGLAAALRRSKLWTQVSGVLCGDDKVRCNKTLTASALASSTSWHGGGVSGFGGHFRAIQGFRYLGEEIS